jgi:hypothetical protein
VNRRGFLRMLGTGAAVGGVAAVAPSQVWPFRKIFLPKFSRIDMLDARLWGRAPYLGPLFEGLEYSPLAHIHALEMEAFAKEIPDLLYRHDRLYDMFKRETAMDLTMRPPFRFPMRFKPWHGINFVQGDMSMENLNRSEIIAGSLNEKPAYKLRRAARKFVDSLKVRNEDLGWDG